MTRTSIIAAAAVTAIVGMLLLPGCSKSAGAAGGDHKCKLTGAETDYWGEIAKTTSGAKKCLVATQPFKCDLDGDKPCTPTLNAIHADTTQAEQEKAYRSALEHQGWLYVGEIGSDDGSKQMAFKKGDNDELYLAFGTSNVSKAFGGDNGLEVFMMRRPKSAKRSNLARFQQAAAATSEP